MNTNLQTIDNMLFAGTAVAAPPVPKPNTFANARQFSPTIDHTNAPESTTADNMPAIARNESVNKPTQDFRQTLRKSQSPRHDHRDNTKPDKQEPASATTSKTNPIQSLPAPANPITLGAYVKEAATKMEPKTGRQLAQLIADVKDDKSNPVTGQAAKSDEIKLLVTTDKGQLGLKTILPESSKGQTGLQSTLPNTSKNQSELQTVLSNIPESTPTADTQPGESKNTDKISVSNGTVITTKAITNGENIKELIPDALAGTNHKTTETNEKTPPVDTSVVAGNPKSSVLSGKKPGPDTLVDDDSKTTSVDTTLTDKSAISNNNEKTPALNTDFSMVQGKFAEPKSQSVGTAPEQSTPITNTPSDSKTTANKILSESSGGNSKESSDTGKKSSNDSTVQKLNITDIQVSTNQTKINNSATFNNNSNSELEQILAHNNSETPVTEQSSSSAEGAKTADLPVQTSLGSVSADIGKQILESIHSSLIQKGQSQQITVRLNPPELGRVFIKFQEQDNQITGLLEVSKTQTRTEIEQALPQIVRSLQESGIQIKRLDVVLSEEEQPEQEALRDQTLQNGWTQQQDSANSYMGGNNPDASEINEWLINNNSYQSISELQEALTTDESINMLI